MAEPIIVSYSELDTYRQCPLKHMLAYKERWTKPLEPGDRRSIGTLVHAVLQVHYRLIRDYQRQWAAKGHRPGEWREHAERVDVRERLLKRIWKDLQPLLYDFTGEQDDQQSLVEWMYKGYVDYYGIDPEWWILGVEVAVTEPLRDARGRKTRYHLKTKIDLVVKDLSNGGIWIVDHKSGQNLPSQFDLEIDDQFGLYTLVLRWRGTKVRGQIHNALRTQRNQADWPEHKDHKTKAQKPEQRMRRTYLNRSEHELTNLGLDALAAAQNAYPPKSRALPLYSSPDPRQCGWKCDFKEQHLLMRMGRKPAEVMAEAGFVQDFTRH